VTDRGPSPTPPTGDLDRTADRLCQFLMNTFGGAVELAEPMTTSGRGFDSDIYFVRVVGASLPEAWSGPLVVRVKTRLDAITEARYEAEVQDWAANHGFPVPRVLHVFERGELADGPAQVIERAPGHLLLDSVMRHPWHARRLLHQMAGLQARLHQLDTSGFPAGGDLLGNRLRLTGLTADALEHAGLNAALGRINTITHELRAAPQAVCHGDFHPMNVIVAGDSMSVIDWTDAGLGDRHGDIARSLLLYNVAYIAASTRTQRIALRRLGPILGRMHRVAYERVLPIDSRRLWMWTAVHALHGWSQAIGARAGAFPDGHTRHAAADRIPPELVEELHRRFDVAMNAVS
jgi:aminoglycoside phosphotransferase (APT) family kinase protein